MNVNPAEPTVVPGATWEKGSAMVCCSQSLMHVVGLIQQALSPAQGFPAWCSAITLSLTLCPFVGPGVEFVA